MSSASTSRDGRSDGDRGLRPRRADRRTFAACSEDVFDAWTSAEVMRRWFHCAPDWDTPEAEGATTVVMVNSGISTDERRDAQDAGWRCCCDELDRVSAG
jgi:hypothetical protein